MIISESTKHTLDWAMQKAYNEDVTMWAFLVKGEEVQTVSNMGNDYKGDSLLTIIANTEAVLASLKERVGDTATA
jgi:hypothetical protein